jgi:predicted nucleotidyltransferase
MGSPSKEKKILLTILENSPLKKWSFQEIMSQTKTTKLVTNKWLKKYTDLGLIKRIKNLNKHPYYQAGLNNTTYKAWKKHYALQEMHESGLIIELMNCEEANTIIIFGSKIKGDWYKDSDIDLFVLGNIRNFNKNIYEKKLNTTIEIHVFQNKNELKKIKSGLLKNIITGYYVKGNAEELIKVIKIEETKK